MKGIIDVRLFGYVQYDIQVPQHLRRYFSNFPAIFRSTAVSEEDIGTLIEEYAEKKNIWDQPRRMLISSFHSVNGTHITLLLLFYLELRLVCMEIHRFVQHFPEKSFNAFVQSAVNERRQGYETQNSSVIPETMKLC